MSDILVWKVDTIHSNKQSLDKRLKMLIKRYLIPITLLRAEILINKYQKALWIKIWIGYDLGYEIKRNFKNSKHLI